ncbi:type VI secretion system tip protein VgrG [Pseudomonas sp. BCA14]|uniref:type VI secretion system Vgr family protein n=1 Tax=unclassified Pseudomonas TaxID=196821 RepID=UPI00106E127E|nr:MULTISPECIES: type VI secretion system tip protein VgrG [unclassified Pseudomonas]TFF04493.1 type VI secretion system tip protein VgrG [Pseudomonas sp. BCA17]TFF05016.1 type VI secretion system tip protein VgrG [Pseudomonas sp. JMN1]TFF19058.1 type VI secretion system tip protein VgrG [Pseudomonas sp. BCA14]TFF26880.1 type VI secretion system tip protein VgrG [Pseudomonas sp. BCA13]
MFAPANQSAFTLAIDGEPSGLKVLEFKGTETISQPYRFNLELVSEQPDLDLESLLHRQAYLGFDDQGHGIHGLVYRVAQGDSGRRLTRYQISVVPHLAYLKHSSHQRIFQHMTVPQIVAQVLAVQGIQSDRFKFQLNSTYLEREYCVQFGETDLAFIQRLCAEQGIHYHFQHSAEGHLLVFGDDQTVFAQAERSTPYTPGSGMVADTPVIRRFTVRLEARATAVNLRDYDFRKPRLTLESEVAGEQLPRLEEHDYPGHFSDRAHGKYLAQHRLERHRSDYQVAHGEGDEPALVSGRFLKLSGHLRDDWNDLWLVTRITHEGKQPQVLEEAVVEVAGGDFRQGYRNEFMAAPWEVIFRPSLPEPPRPRISGYQHAVVTGPEDSEVHCDEYGRVKVQMAWDRTGEHNDHSSCWLRVVSAWAHDRYGSVLIPRVGMEVLVGFVNGDLDMPVVMGCLPNAATPVPLELPADKTRSILRSQSSPGGGGYNELRIEDRKGAEEIYLRAQRDWTQHVLHDQQLQVDNSRRVRVGGGSHHELQGEEQRITHGNRLTELKQDDHLVVGGSQHMRAGRTIQIGAGQSVVIDAGASVTIQAGGQSITVSAGGIFSSVPIQLGGAPVPAVAPLVPGIKEKLLAVIPAPLSRAQVTSLKRSAPFCEECERCKHGQCDLPPHSG